MSDITNYEKRFTGQIETTTNPNPGLASPFEIGDLEFSVTSPLFNEDGVVPTVDGSVVIRDISTGYPEGINVKVGNISSDGLTVTLTDLSQRGQPISGENGVDYEGGSVTNRSFHGQNSEVRWQISPLDHQMIADSVDGVIGSGKKFNARPTYTGVGIGADRTFANATARDAAITSPAEGDTCRLIGVATQKYNGASWESLGVQDPVTASLGCEKVGQDIRLDIAATNDIQKLTGNELDTNLTANKTEIDQLSGTTNIAEANTFFGATDITGAQAETLSDGSNADSLHVHAYTDLIGDPTTKARDTNHQATENGFLYIQISGGTNAVTDLTVKTDASATPTTVVGIVQYNQPSSTLNKHFLYPIKKDNYYNVTTTTDTGTPAATKTVKFIPMT